MPTMSRLLERFLRYVVVDTTADPDSTTYPSSACQFDLGRLLVRELQEIGLQEVALDERGLVWGTVPATVPGDLPVVAFNAHIDTSPETTGKNVRPQVIRDYAGGDIVLPGDPTKVIRVAESPELDRAPRPHAHHHRRHDAARRRRQGGHRRDHRNGGRD